MKSKILSLTLACLLSAWGMYAQNSEVLVSNAVVHVLYRNHNNPLQISVPGVSHEAISVTCDKAVVTKDKTGLLWHVLPTDFTAEMITLKIYTKANGKESLVQEQTYKVIELKREVLLRETRIIYDSINGREQTKQIEYRGATLRRMGRKGLNKYTEIVADYPYESMLSDPLNIIKYETTIRRKKYETTIRRKVYACEGNKFSKDILKAIAQLQYGDMILIYNILAKDYAGNDILLDPITIVLK